MTWSEIAVYVKKDDGGQAYVGIATRLARRCGARVTGVFPLRNVALLKGLSPGSSASGSVARYAREAYCEAATYESRFRQLAAAESIGCDWQVCEGDPSQAMILAARVSDLAIVEQCRPGIDESGWDVPEEVALHAGTPTLVVPHAHRGENIGARVLVAWNGSREASLTVTAAMPLIENAKTAVILNGDCREYFATVTRRPAMDVQRLLRSRCVDLECIDFTPRHGGEGAAILAAARCFDCDLIVMGAYGRSRSRELLLGGATRHVMQRMDRPVLFAH